jgi:hypothetical protein
MRMQVPKADVLKLDKVLQVSTPSLPASLVSGALESPRKSKSLQQQHNTAQHSGERAC